MYVTAQGVDGKVAQGSGFFVTLEGKRWILTNRHVVQGAEEVSVAPQGKNPKRAPAYKISPDLDLAVIDCPADLKVRPLVLAKQPVNPGAEIFALGFPLGVANVISRGIVGAVEDDYFLFDAPISSGNSGGPVVNRMGEVIGVATMGSRAVDGAVVQNLNVGIQVSAIPRLQMFTDPLLRIAAISDRIRTIEWFVEDGFARGDFLTLSELLVWEWTKEVLRDQLGSHWGETPEARKVIADFEQKRRSWESSHGTIRSGIDNWIVLLKDCEAQIDTIPAAFAGLGQDPLLAEFLRDDRLFKIVPVNATAELLRELARIGADHWLSRFEDLRYRLEWLVRYSKLPSTAELAALEDSKAERPSIRLKFSITGDRTKDLEQYTQTLLKWKDRQDVRDDVSNRLSSAYGSPVSGNLASRKAQAAQDATKSETLHGDILGQISGLWQHLAIAAGDRGDIDQAIRLVRRDLEGKSPSHWAGAMLAKYLVFAGSFPEAWQAYRDHFLGESPFNAFALTQGRGEMGLMNAWFDIGVEIPVPDRKKFPEVARRVEEWNATLSTVKGRDLRSLGQMTETLASDWFKGLDELAMLRVLFYYRWKRPEDKDRDHFSRTGSLRDSQKRVDEWTEFEPALQISKEAEALWKRATTDRKIDFPL